MSYSRGKLEACRKKTEKAAKSWEGLSDHLADSPGPSQVKRQREKVGERCLNTQQSEKAHTMTQIKHPKIYSYQLERCPLSC